MLRFRFPRCPPFRICFRELAPSELKHAFADAGSAPENLESSQCQSFFFFVPSCAVYVSRMVRGRHIIAFCSILLLCELQRLEIKAASGQEDKFHILHTAHFLKLEGLTGFSS